MRSMLKPLSEKTTSCNFFLKTTKKAFHFSFLWKYMGYVFDKVSIILVLTQENEYSEGMPRI